MARISILILTLTLCSCYAPKRAARDLRKVFVHYPQLIAEHCATQYPVKPITEIRTRYLPGKDSFVIDTVEVECPDSVRTVSVPITKYHLRVDTFTRDSIVEIENTARISFLENEAKDARATLLLEQQKHKTTRRWLNIAASFSVLSGLAFLILFYRKVTQIFSVKSLLK